jgi:hypothetical protein
LSAPVPQYRTGSRRGCVERVCDGWRKRVTPSDGARLYAQQRAAPWHAIKQPCHVEQIAQTDFMYAAAPGTGEEAVHRLVFENAHGARYLAKLGGIDHEHGVGGFDISKEAETERAAIDEGRRSDRRLGSQPFDQPDADAIIAKQDIPYAKHQDVRCGAVACRVNAGIHCPTSSIVVCNWDRHRAPPSDTEAVDYIQPVNTLICVNAWFAQLHIMDSQQTAYGRRLFSNGVVPQVRSSCSN